MVKFGIELHFKSTHNNYSTNYIRCRLFFKAHLGHPFFRDNFDSDQRARESASGWEGERIRFIMHMSVCQREKKDAVDESENAYVGSFEI